MASGSSVDNNSVGGGDGRGVADVCLADAATAAAAVVAAGVATRDGGNVTGGSKGGGATTAMGVWSIPRSAAKLVMSSPEATTPAAAHRRGASSNSVTSLPASGDAATAPYV